MYISPMLLNSIKEIPDINDSSIVELKLDGFRTILSNMDGNRIYSRHKTEISKSFPELFEHNLPEKTVLDGETIQADPITGQPCFEAVMGRFHMRNAIKIKHLAEADPVTFCVFDILYYRGKNVMSLPLLKRKELLEEALPTDTRSIVKVRYMDGVHAAALFKACQERKLEGAVLKQNKPYLPGSRPKGYWDKIICYTEADVRITGIRKTKFGWLATYPDGRFAGVIELSVPAQAKKVINEIAWKYGRDVGPYVNLPEGVPCKVNYRALTKNGLMRLAEFKEFVQ